MSRDLVIGNACRGKGRERGLKGHDELAFEHGVDIGTVVTFGDVAADVGVEQKRVNDLVRIHAVAAEVDGKLETELFVDDHFERDGVLSAEFIIGDLFSVEIVNSLVLGGFAAERDTFADRFERFDKVLAELAVEERRFAGRIVKEFACFCAEFGDLALVDDDHALTFVDGDDRTVGDNVIGSFGIGAPFTGAVNAFGNKSVRI